MIDSGAVSLKPGKKPEKGKKARKAPPGLSARLCAHRLVEAVLIDNNTLDQALRQSSENPEDILLEPRDRAFARTIAATTLRRLGQINDLLDGWIAKPLPVRARRSRIIMATGLAELLFLDVKPYAAVNAAVMAAARHHTTRPLRNLVNAILRRALREGKNRLSEQDSARLNTPAWLWDKWVGTYGELTTRAIAQAHLADPPLDLSVKADPAVWAAKLGAVCLPTGTVRLKKTTSVKTLEGFREGEWWVQDAAAALPVRLLGNIAGEDVLDLCAAPGGKTMQLAAAGARVRAIDRSQDRLELLHENLERLGLEVQTEVADLVRRGPGRRWKYILLDAPCSATGTARRHPDVLHLKTAREVKTLAAVQQQLLHRAVDWLVPAGTLVYCTCSLEPEEGPHQIARLLANRKDLARKPVTPEELPSDAGFITAEGDVRTLPCDWHKHGGLDGFYAARLVRD